LDGAHQLIIDVDSFLEVLFAIGYLNPQVLERRKHARELVGLGLERSVDALVGLLGILGTLVAIAQVSGTSRALLSAVSIALFMASAYSFLLFRHSLIPVGTWALRTSSIALAGVTAACIAANLDGTVARPSGSALAVDIVTLLAWCGVVGASILRLWRVSGTLPSVQRARLRALNAGFTGIVIALLGTVVATVAAQSTTAEVAVYSVVLLSMPLLAVSLSPPGWLRRVWREREEIQLRHAINNLLLYSADEITLAERALEWAARLLGGGAALLVLNGRVLAVSGIDLAAGERLHRDLEDVRDSAGLSFTSSLGATAVVPLHSQAGDGFLAVLGGPFTPLFGDEELARLGQYAVSITVALDRVHLVVGVRRNAELLDLAYDAVFSWDFASRAIQYWNKAASELYGYSSAEALNRDSQELLQTQYSVPVHAIMAALSEHDHWEGELVQRTKDGRTLSTSARWAVQRDVAGKPLSVLEINRDISNEKRVADELRRASELFVRIAPRHGASDLLEQRPLEDAHSATPASSATASTIP